MLILSRRSNESLRIGDDVIVTVLGVNGRQIRLGIAAPKHVAVDREEVYQRKLYDRGATGSPVSVAPDTPRTDLAGSTASNIRPTRREEPGKRRTAAR